VYRWTRGVDFEVIVVDNASQDGTPEMVMTSFPQATLVRRAENAGFAVAVNQGAQIARGAHFFLLNPDSELTSDVLPPMLDYLRRHPDIGILAPKIVDEDGSVQLSVRSFPSFHTALFNRYSLLTRLFPRNPFSRRYLLTDVDHDAILDVDWASAACWLLPRLTYERVGPLDEGYFWSIEDVDYCQRVHRAGLRVVYFPRVSVRHRIGGSAATARRRTILARHDGMWRYYKTYLRPAGGLRQPLLDALVWSGIRVRCWTQLAGEAVRSRLKRDGG
jgi:hypothetical protein